MGSLFITRKRLANRIAKQAFIREIVIGVVDVDAFPPAGRPYVRTVDL